MKLRGYFDQNTAKQNWNKRNYDNTSLTLVLTYGYCEERAE